MIDINNYYFVNPNPPKIEQLTLNITSKCNYSCPMCPFHGEGYDGSFFSEYPELKGEMTYKNIENIFIRASEYGITKIDLTSYGEFFAYKAWREIFKLAKTYNIKLSMTTNGGLLSNDDIRYICESGVVDYVCVSVDSVNYDTYKVVRRPASYDSFNKALNAPILFKKYGNKKLLYVHVAVVEQEENSKEINEVLNFYGRYKINQISIGKKMTIKQQESLGAENSNVAHISGLCKNWRFPIVLIDGTMIGCCAMVYAKHDIAKKIPNLLHQGIRESFEILDEIYKTDIAMQKFCQQCQLFSLGAEGIKEKFIYRGYYAQRDNLKTIYYAIPYGLAYLPRRLVLHFYKVNFVKKLSLFMQKLGRHKDANA